MLWSIVMFALAAFGVQAQRIVDLTPKSEDSSAIHERVDCRGRGTGRIGPPPTVTITVTALDSRQYAMGGQIVADIHVKNVGKERVVLPSVLTQDFGRGFSLPPYAIEASLGMLGIDAEGREVDLTGTVLRGSPSRFGTTESLAPGESLTFRFPGWIVIVDGASAPATGQAKLFARLLLRDNECRDWERVMSEPVDIWLRGRE